MKRETRRQFRQLAYFSSLGFSIALSIFIGLGIGLYLDREVFQTTPYLTLLFLVLGILAGFRNIALAIKKSRKL
jgi:ATP synthase protein I